MKNNQNKKKFLSKNKENINLNNQENIIEELKVKLNPKKFIKKIFLPVRKEKISNYKIFKTNINNNSNFLQQNNYLHQTNNNKVNRKLIFLKEKRNSVKEDKHMSNLNTERNNEKNLQRKKKAFKISTNDEIFDFYKKKSDKDNQRSNKITNSNNYVDPLNKALSFKNDSSLNDNSKKSFELIEKFADNFRNKDRSESLKNALNMYKRYKSLSSLSNKNKLNNSFSSITIVKNKSYYQNVEKNFINAIKKQENRENHLTNNIGKNKGINNFLNDNFEKRNNKIKDDKKYFLRKVIREEKCYMDDKGKIHVVGFKQSLIDDKNKDKNNNKKNMKKNNKNNKSRKINVEINQINNINSYNNIGHIHSIKNLKNNKKNSKNLKDKKYNNLTERNEPDKLRIIGLSKRISKNKKNRNIKYYENKLANISKKIDKNIINNNTSFDRISHRAIHSFGKNYSIYYSYNNRPEVNLSDIYDTNNYSNINCANQNCLINNTMNDYNYKNHYEPYYNRRIYAQNNDNCSFYESKSFSTDKERLLKNHIDYISNLKNNIFDVNYTNNFDNNINRYANNKTFLNGYILDYNFNHFNSRQNTGKISSYRLIRIPKYNY